MVLLHKSQFYLQLIVVLIKASFDENMFYHQCGVSHHCGCPRQLTYFIRFQEKDRGKEGSSKIGSCILYVKKDSCVIHDRGHGY